MVTLGQKLNMPKTCEKRFYIHITVVLGKKPLLKTANIREMRRFLKSVHLAKAIGFPKSSLLGQKLNMQKRCKKRFYNHITVVLCKKAVLKTANIREMRRF